MIQVEPKNKWPSFYATQKVHGTVLPLFLRGNNLFDWLLQLYKVFLVPNESQLESWNWTWNPTSKITLQAMDKKDHSYFLWEILSTWLKNLPWTPKTMKNNGFGRLKPRLFTIKTSKDVGFGGPWCIYIYVPADFQPTVRAKPVRGIS